MGFIFGGDTGMTYEDLQRKRKIAEQLMQANTRTPRNVGEGIHAIGRALAGRAIEKRAARRDEELRGQFEDQFAKVAPNTQGLIDLAESPYAGKAHASVIEALLNGAPNYRRGAAFHPGGKAVVGEYGPEVVDLPRGARVVPSAPPGQVVAQGMPIDPTQYDSGSQERLLQPGADVAPAPIDPRELIEQSRFMDDQAVQVVDASGAYPLKPSGVGEENQINTAAAAYRTFNNALDDYDTLVAEGGVAIMPGEQKDSIRVARRNLQMQMKELYNLGVLNGPDLALMNEILIDPNGLWNKFLDVTGVADTEGRVENNIDQVRKIMRQMVEPKLKSMGVSPEQIYQPKGDSLENMSDDDLMKLLGG